MSKQKLRQRSSSEERCAYCHSSLDEEFTAVCNSCGCKLHEDCRSNGCPTIGCSSNRNTSELVTTETSKETAEIEESACEHQTTKNVNIVFKCLVFIVPFSIFIAGNLLEAARFDGLISFDRELAIAMTLAGFLSLIPVGIYYWLTEPSPEPEPEYKCYGRD